MDWYRRAGELGMERMNRMVPKDWGWKDWMNWYRGACELGMEGLVSTEGLEQHSGHPTSKNSKNAVYTILYTTVLRNLGVGKWQHYNAYETFCS